MAKITISEYSSLPGALASEPAAVEQELSFTGTAAASTAFAADTKCVRLNSDSTCRILFGSAPVALATSKRMPADSTEYFVVTGGHKVSAITST